MSLFRRARGRMVAPALLLVLFTLLASCATEPGGNAPSTTAPTVAEAEKFMADAEARLNDLGLRAQRASWVQSNFITEDTEVLAADTNKDYIAAVTELAEKSRRFGDELARRFDGAILYWDERLTTVEASRYLRDSGMRRQKRRDTIDAAAAAVLLQGYLDYLRRR